MAEDDAKGSHSGRSVRAAGSHRSWKPAVVEPVRLSRVGAAVAVLASLSSAPFVQLSLRVTHDPLSGSGWPYVYSYFGAALLSVALVVIDVLPRLDSVSKRFVLLPLALLGVWALLSAGWTDSPQVTPTQAVLFAALLFFAPWFGGVLSRSEQGLSLLVVTQVLTLASWLFGVVAPTSTIDLYGRWSGVFANRNTLGPIAALAALTALSVLLRFGVRSPWSTFAVPLMLADLFIVVKSGSDTAAIGFVAAVLSASIVLPVTMIWRRRGWPPVTLAIGAVLSVVVGWFVSFALIARLAEAIGKDPTLSNRRVIWSYVRTQFGERPVSGFGFGSFWNDPQRIDPETGLTAISYGSAHSTFLEIVLGLGVIGGALLAIVWLQVAWGVGRTVWVEWQSPRLVAPVVMVAVFMLVENLTESMVTLHSIFWVILVSAAFIEPSPQPDS